VSAYPQPARGSLDAAVMTDPVLYELDHRFSKRPLEDPRFRVRNASGMPDASELFLSN